MYKDFMNYGSSSLIMQLKQHPKETLKKKRLKTEVFQIFFWQVYYAV